MRWQTLQVVRNYLGQPSAKRDCGDLSENVTMPSEYVIKEQKIFSTKHHLTDDV